MLSLFVRYLILTLILLNLPGCFLFDQSHVPDVRTLAVEEYRAGLRALNVNDLVQAEIHFRTAMASQINYAPGLEGMARIHLKRNNFIEAERFLERSIKSDINWVPAYIVKSRIYLENEDFDLAREELLLAQKLIKRHHLKNFEIEIQPLLAAACFGLGNFAAAAEHFKRALDQFPDDARLRQKLETSNFYAQILKSKNRRLVQVMRRNQINRADLALLMHNFLPFKPGRQALDQIPIHDLPQDKELSEAIQMCTENFYLPILPDQTFRPTDKVDRAEMALFIEQILNRNYPYDVPMNSIKVIDVGRFEPFTRAVYLVLGIKIMQRNEDQHFRPYAVLTGPEALVVVHRLAEFLELPVFPAHFLRDQSIKTKKD